MVVRANVPIILIFVIIVMLPSFNQQDAFAASSLTLARFGGEKFSFPEQRFLLYDVNPGEGFNLRRDVYIRIVNTVRQLRDRGNDFILVLPPWRKLFHWRNLNVEIPWRDLFNIESLRSFVPVIELDEFIERNGNESLDLVVYLQHYAEGWSDTEGFLLKYDVRSCLEAHKYYKQHGLKWEGPFFEREMLANELKCISIQGQSSTLADAIIQLFPKGRSLMVDRAETILHDRFGDVYYWQARKSMSYAESLKMIANKFLLEKFPGMNYSNNSFFNNTKNYICVHLRRRDFIWSHPGDIPSIKGAAKQLVNLANLLQMKNVFISTDTSMDEIKELTDLLNNDDISVWRFDSSGQSDAANAIIDQLICSYAGYFIGTHQSTFSYRIHEDREIFGRPSWTTFNRLCPDGQDTCEQPAKWTIVSG